MADGTRRAGSWNATGALLLLVTALMTGGAALGAQEAPASLPAEGLEPGVHPVLVLPGAAADQGGQEGAVVLHLVVAGMDAAVASFQGVLRYDPDRVEVGEVTFAQGALGAFNVVEPGVVRFAGLKPEGLEGSAVAVFQVEAPGALRADAFTELVLEEVTAAVSFEDLTGRVREWRVEG